MNQAEFEAQLQRDGFEVEVKQTQGPVANPEHSHPFEVRALVLEGQITLTCGGREATYQAGDVFVMPAGMPHSEVIPATYRYVVGKRQPANA